MVNLRATEFSYEVERQTFATCEADPLQDLFQAEQNAAKKIDLANSQSSGSTCRASRPMCHSCFPANQTKVKIK